MHRKQSYTEWLCDRNPATRPRELTDEEQRAIDRGFCANERQAQSVARRIVGEATLAQEVVQSAITRMIHAALQGRMPIPATVSAFGRQLRGYVRNVAKQAVRGAEYEPPRHSFWGEVPAPVSGRKMFERLLATDCENVHDLEGELAVSDEGDDAYLPVPHPKYRAPSWPRPHPTVMSMDLIEILDAASAMLPYMQSQVVQRTLEDAGRDIVSNVLGIAPKTYDTHLARGRNNMRNILLSVEWECANVDEWGREIPGRHRSEWNDIFAEMEQRRLRREEAKHAAKRELPKAA